MITLSSAVGASKGFSAGETVGLLTAFNLASGVSRLLMGYLSDRIGRRVSMSVMSAAGGAAYLCLPYSEAVGAVAVLAAVIGFAFGTLFTVSAPLAVECFGMEHFGPILGLVFTAYGYLAGILGPWLSGALVDRAGGDPAWACAYLGAFCLLSSVIVLGVKPQRGMPSVE
jgi:OFA family oxalate/formate antiporter-like MFS transporter